MNKHIDSALQDYKLNIEGLIQFEQEAAAPVIKWTKLCNICLIAVLLICMGIFFNTSGDSKIGAAIAYLLTMAFIVFNFITKRELEERPMKILMSQYAYKYQFQNKTDDEKNNS